MKKGILLLILCVLMIICFACTATPSGNRSYDVNSNLFNIEGENDLYYYSTTHVVYIVFNECPGYSGYGYMSPYYSENGNLCKYDPEKKVITEIVNE